METRGEGGQHSLDLLGLSEEVSSGLRRETAEIARQHKQRFGFARNGEVSPNRFSKGKEPPTGSTASVNGRALGHIASERTSRTQTSYGPLTADSSLNIAISLQFSKKAQR